MKKKMSLLVDQKLIAKQQTQTALENYITMICSMQAL